ncbi:MAG: hypothetical protein HZB56_01770 [Deltaproteobacteria bacterium]|nr:hypothetical protein [Deltaproteobacteria bacterium]
MAKAKQSARLCATSDVVDLGKALIAVADEYPTQFLTERDFFSLARAYLHGRFPGVSAEHRVKEGAIDFRLGGTNPSVLELAVAPRALADACHKQQRFPGHISATQLYASQNRSELRKLARVAQAKARKRYLLLLDLRGLDHQDLKAGYLKWSARRRGGSPIRVVHVRRDSERHFVI